MYSIDLHVTYLPMIIGSHTAFRVARAGIEAAMLGAYVLSLHGHAPLLLDLRASSSDDDHIVTPYMLDGRWGCLSKSNHAALRCVSCVLVG